MSSYYANAEIDAYTEQQAHYQDDVSAWQEIVAAAQAEHEQREAEASAQWDTLRDEQLAAYEEAHAAWEANPNDVDGNALPEPMPPDPPPDTPAPPEPSLPPEPTPPEPPATTYSTRELTDAEQIDTQHGLALVLPPALVVTSSDGRTFATSDDEFARSYTDVEDVDV